MEIYIFIIVTAITVSVLAVGCALFSYLLDYCFWPGSIFKGYLPFLAKTLLPKSDVTEVKLLAKDLQPEEYVKRAENYMLFKLFGGCIYCFNVWLTFVSFAILNSFLDFGWYFIFFYTPVSHFFLRKILD